MLRAIALAASGFLVITGADARGRGDGYGSHLHVHGYSTSRGTYVQTHYRTAPNGTMLDNWSARGNVNSYTGRPGTRVPFGGSAYGYGQSSKEPGYQSSQPAYAPPKPEGYDFRLRYEANLADCIRNKSSCNMDLVYNKDIAKIRDARVRYGADATSSRVSPDGMKFKARIESNLRSCLGRLRYGHRL